MTRSPRQPTDAPATPSRPAYVLDVIGVARLLDVSRSTVYQMIAEERLPAAVRIGRRPRWLRVELEAWLAHGAPSRKSWERVWPRVRGLVFGNPQCSRKDAE